MVCPRSMDKEQFPQEAELSNGHVGGTSSLQTFDTTDTNSDMSCLDHGYIVGTVANGKKQRFQMTLDKLDHEGFLKRRNTARKLMSKKRIEQKKREKKNSPANNCFAQNGQVQEKLLHILFQSKSQ